MQLPKTNDAPQPASLRRNADFVIDLLAEAGIDTVFGLPSGAIAPMFDALYDRKDVRVVQTTHENAAVFAAAGYAAQSNKPGVVLVTSGPGVLNAVNALASAHLDGLPVVLLVGEVARSNTGRLALQEGSEHGLNIANIVRSFTKMVECVTQPALLPAMLTRALAISSSGRKGPVVLTLPIDVLVAKIAPPVFSAAPRVEFGIDAQSVQTVADELSTSERLFILAGNGCRSAATSAALVALAERLGCPVATTPKGKGVFPETHPCALGVLGTGGHPSVYRTLAKGVDTVLTVGTSLGELATDGWNEQLKPVRNFIQIDVEARSIGRNFPVTHAIIGKAEQVLKDIIAALPAKLVSTRSFGIDEDTTSEQNTGGGIVPAELLRMVQESMPPDAIYCSDIGEHLLFATHFLRIERADSWFVMSGLGSMASGITGAMGLQIASPNRRVVCVCGDGGMMMTLGELSTAVRQKLAIVYLVMNDQRYSMVELGHQALYGRTPAFPVGSTHLVDAAKALGCRAMRLDTTNDREMLSAALRESERSPLVIDARVDRNCAMKRHKRFETLCGIDE